MAKSSQAGPKRSGGRPSEFKPEYVEQVHRLALLGLRDVEMASVLGVSEVTFNTWKTKHPEFLVSLNNGKADADGKVVQALYRKATGILVEGKPDKDGKTEVYAVPPDTTACIFWLKNRQKANWRDKVDHAIEGKDGADLFPPSLIAAAAKLAKEL